MALVTRIKRPLELQLPQSAAPNSITVEILKGTITVNSTTTTRTAGSLGVAVDNATPTLFISDGAKWQYLKNS